MRSELSIVCDVSLRLQRLGVAHMLTGSVAMNYYAEPRMTRDIDVVVALGPEKVRSLVGEFGRDYYVDEGAVAEATRSTSMFNMLHLESMVKVDCIVRKRSRYREAEFERRREIDIEGVRTSIVSKEDLILSKLVWAKDSRSEMQLRDVRNLMATGYDSKYLDRWKGELGVGDLLEEIGHG
jgi:hypothetical protein